MKRFDYEIVKNPHIFEENRLPVHSEHICMSNWFEAEYNSLRMYLDDLWKFSHASNIENVGLEFEVEKYFSLPVNMRGERVCISFQGAQSRFGLWLNGCYVGYSESSFIPVEFELTPYLQEGENKLSIRVWKEERDFAYISVSELFRSVYLYMVPRTHIWDLQVETELSEDFSEGVLTVITTTCGKGEVEVRLLDDTMQEVLGGVMMIEEGEEGSDEIQSGIAGAIVSPKLWNAEEPNLYMLQLEVRDEHGDLTEVVSQQVCFRRMECQNDTVIVNGTSIVYNGINYRIFSQEQKRVLSREEILKDIVTMKQNNINAIHVCDDAVDAYLYELCDSYGIYVVAESETKFHENCEQLIEMQTHEPLPKMQEIKYRYQNISVSFEEKTFTIWNKNPFLNTKQYDAAVILQKDGRDIAKFAMDISVEPFEKHTYDIPQQLMDIMDNLKIASVVHGGGMPEFAITVSFCLKEDNDWGKRGDEVAFGQYIYKKEVQPYVCNDPVELVKKSNDIVVKGRYFETVFSSEKAGLVSYVYGGVELLKCVPHPNFWCTMPEETMDDVTLQSYAQWKIASLYVRGKSQADFPCIEELEHSIKLTYTYFMPTSPASSCEVCYHVFGDGTIETTMTYEPVEGLGDMPEFGMLFQLAADFDRLCWYGLGPEETYINRMRGGKLGVYENKVADNMANYLVPQECGNKCEVRYAELTNSKGRGMRFFGDSLSLCALPYTPHELENATHAYELPQVHHTVVRVAKDLRNISKKKVFTFCFRGV